MYNLGNTLYKLDSKGKTREWKIEVVDNSTFASIVTTAGLQDGKQVVNTIDVYEGKNIGKSNETNYYTQAVAEALATAELKLRGEYRTTLDDMQHQTLRSGIKAPMLAQTLDLKGERKNSKTLEKFGLLNKEVGLQYKLDGNRMLIVVNKDSTKAYSRKGDLMPIQLSHILDDITLTYKKLNLNKEIVLDGEVFTPAMSFNESNGLLKRFKDQSNPKLLEFKYYLYDVMSNQGYKEREVILNEFVSTNVVKLNTEYVKATPELISDKLREYVGLGNEGLILRQLNKPYENKRSAGLLKLKQFSDSEFILEGMEEDARGGFVGAFIMGMDVEAITRDGAPILTFKAGVVGMSQEYLSKVWNEKEKYIGTKCTVEYFDRSEYSVPRFGKLKELNRVDM